MAKARQLMTRAEMLARVLETAKSDDDGVVAQYAERLVDEVLEDHDPYYKTPSDHPNPNDGYVDEDAIIDLLGRVLKWLDRDRCDLSALVERLAVDSGVALPYVAAERLDIREVGKRKAHPEAWVVRSGRCWWCHDSATFLQT